MIDRNTGEVYFANDIHLGPKTSLADFQQLVGFLHATKVPTTDDELWPGLEEWEWYGNLESDSRDYKINVCFYKNLVRNIDICILLGPGDISDAASRRRSNLDELTRLHRKLLKRLVGGMTPNNEFTWGLVNQCHADPDADAEDLQQVEGEDIIRINYQYVKAPPLVRRFFILRILAAIGFYSGVLMLVINFFFGQWAAEFFPTPRFLSRGALYWFIAAVILRLAWETVAGGFPGSTEEIFRWPCPACCNVGQFGSLALKKVSGPPDDFYDRSQCPNCGATFSSDSMSYHPRLNADTPPESLKQTRWPHLYGAYREAEQFRTIYPDNMTTEDKETELEAFIRALEGCLLHGAGIVAPILAVIILPLLVLFTGKIVPALVLIFVALLYIGDLDVRLQSRRYKFICRRQIDEYLKRTGISPADFKAHVARILGSKGRLLICLNE